MLLTADWIEKLLVKKLGNQTWSSASQRWVENPEYREIAHAIAEAQKAGVLLRCLGEVRVNYAEGFTEVIYQNSNLWSGIRIAKDTLDELDGRRACVTVSVEEKDGQGMD